MTIITVLYLFSHFIKFPSSSFPQFPKAFPAALTSSKQASCAGRAPRNKTYPISTLNQAVYRSGAAILALLSIMFSTANMITKITATPTTAKEHPPAAPVTAGEIRPLLYGQNFPKFALKNLTSQYQSLN